MAYSEENVRSKSGPIVSGTRTTLGVVVAAGVAVATIILGVQRIVSDAGDMLRAELRREIDTRLGAAEKRLDRLEDRK